MRIAAIVPIGYLDRQGYQRIWDSCHADWLSWTDDLYIMPSVPGFEEIAIDRPSVHFARKPDGSYWFNAFRVMENVNLGIQYAQEDGCDAAIILMCNNYMINGDEIYEAADAIVQEGDPFGWYMRYDQLGDQLLGPSVKLPFLINLKTKYKIRTSIDSLIVEETVVWFLERGDFLAIPPCVVDVQLEMTTEELRDKINFVRGYSDLVKKRPSTFSRGYWIPYYYKKFKAKAWIDDKIDHSTFKEIAGNHQENYVSAEILRRLKEERNPGGS